MYMYIHIMCIALQKWSNYVARYCTDDPPQTQDMKLILQDRKVFLKRYMYRHSAK